MAFPPIPTQVNCPKCHKPFIAQVYTIIDVGNKPELKEDFLRGRVNYAQCPDCGTGGILSTPILYHDPAKELLIAYVPAELGLSAQQQEQFIGGLVNTVMESVPAEQRKGYFLQPKTALTLDSLMDMILEADGITKEMLEAQRARLRLINTLAAAVADEPTLDKLVQEHRQELTYEFLLLLSDLIEAQEQEGNAERAKTLQTLREKLLARVNPVPQMARQDATVEELIKLLQETGPGDAWRTAIALNRPRLDYSFFQALTAKIDAAQGAGDAATAEKLTDLRRRILDELDAQDKLLRDAQDKASLLIMTLLEAQDLDAALRAHRQEINEIFLSVLARYEATARAQGDVSRAEGLKRILDAAITLLEEGLPADVRLINRLLRAEFPDGTNAILEEHRGFLNAAFLETCDRYIANLKQDGDTALAEHLQQVRGQVEAKLAILRP